MKKMLSGSAFFKSSIIKIYLIRFEDRKKKVCECKKVANANSNANFLMFAAFCKYI